MIHVVIADDQPLVRTGLRMILSTEADIEVVGEAANGAEAVAVCATQKPDVVLMDVRMPEVDGIEATRRLTVSEDPPKILVLTTFDLDEVVYDALRAGASGFLIKDVRPEQLADAVRVVTTGEALLAPGITRRLIEQFVSRPAPSPGAPQQLDELSERELEVLKLIARGQSNDEIALELFVTRATVKTHVTHILTKLRLRDRVQAVVLAYECGLVQPGAAEQP